MPKSKKSKKSGGNPAAFIEKRQKVADVDIVTTNDVERERELIFTINGQAYYIDKKPHLNTSIAYLKIASSKGEAVALGFLLEKVLGEEAFDAFAGYDDLDADTIERVIERVKVIGLGGLERPKGR